MKIPVVFTLSYPRRTSSEPVLSLLPSFENSCPSSSWRRRLLMGLCGFHWDFMRASFSLRSIIVTSPYVYQRRLSSCLGVILVYLVTLCLSV